MKDGPSAITYVVLEFVDAARLWGTAALMYDNKTCGKAVNRAIVAELKIRDLTGSVDVLLPLLRHENPAVRYYAAIALLCDHRDEAVAALKVVDETAELEIAFAAGSNLEMMGEPNRGTGPEGPYPFPEKIPTSAERYAILQGQLREIDDET